MNEHDKELVEKAWRGLAENAVAEDGTITNYEEMMTNAVNKYNSLLKKFPHLPIACPNIKAGAAISINFNVLTLCFFV